MELNINTDNIVIVKLSNGMEIIGYDKTEDGDLDHLIEKAYFVELKLDNSNPSAATYKPEFIPLSMLVDPKESLNSEMTVRLPASTVLFKLPVNPVVIPHYKPLVSPIIM